MAQAQTEYFSADDLRPFFREVFARIGCPRELSEPVINGLIETSLRGVDSHGVRLIPHYVQAAQIGRVNLAPKMVFIPRSPSVALLDADHAYGIAAASRGMVKAIDMARSSGVGCVAVFNSSHYGASAIYALMAAREDMIGLSFTSVDSLVLPFGGKQAYLGTNPICFATPCDGEEPFCLDMATSSISWNKLLQHRSTGMEVETGCAADFEGEPCVDPHKVAALLPLAGYKGYGLALMVEILCSILTNMPYGPRIPRMYPLTPDRRYLGHFLMAIDLASFGEPDVIKKRTKELLNDLRRQPPSQGYERVMVADDPQKEAMRRRLVEGIPIERADLKRLFELAQMLGMSEDWIKIGGCDATG